MVNLPNLPLPFCLFALLHFCPFSLLSVCQFALLPLFHTMLCPCTCNLPCCSSNVYGKGKGKIWGQTIVWNKGKRAKIRAKPQTNRMPPRFCWVGPPWPLWVHQNNLGSTEIVFILCNPDQWRAISFYRYDMRVFLSIQYDTIWGPQRKPSF